MTKCIRGSVVLSIVVTHAGCGKPISDPTVRHAPSFTRDVRPILSKHCFSCHGEDEDLQNGLDLRELSRILAGGVSGPAVIPGNPKESLLYEMILLDEMPPEDDKLISAEKELIRRWLANNRLQE